MSALEITIRTVLSFVTVFIWARILGKKLISQITFFDFIAGISLGSMVGSIILSTNVALWVALLGLSIFAAMALALDVISISSFFGRKVINGEPTLVIKDGKILEEGMKKTRLTVDDLLYLLRKQKYFYVDQIELAFLETDGTLSALTKPEYTTVTRKDLQIVAASRGLPQTFIIDGQILENTLASTGHDKEWVESVLKSQGIDDLRQVALAQVDQQDKVYIDKRHDSIH